MVWAGTRGETAEEMARVLPLPDLPPEKIHAAFTALRERRLQTAVAAGSEWREGNGVFVAERTAEVPFHTLGGARRPFP